MPWTTSPMEAQIVSKLLSIRLRRAPGDLGGLVTYSGP